MSAKKGDIQGSTRANQEAAKLALLNNDSPSEDELPTPADIDNQQPINYQAKLNLLTAQAEENKDSPITKIKP